MRVYAENQRRTQTHGPWVGMKDSISPYGDHLVYASIFRLGLIPKLCQPFCNMHGMVTGRNISECTTLRERTYYGQFYTRMKTKHAEL